MAKNPSAVDGFSSSREIKINSPPQPAGPAKKNQFAAPAGRPREKKLIRGPAQRPPRKKINSRPRPAGPAKKINSRPRPAAPAKKKLIRGLGPGRAPRGPARRYTSLGPFRDHFFTKTLCFARFHKGLAPKRGRHTASAGRPAAGRLREKNHSAAPDRRPPRKSK